MKTFPFLLVCLLMSLPTKAQYAFSYTNFSNAPLLTLEEAAYKKDKFVVLTPNEAGKQSGQENKPSVWKLCMVLENWVC
jgi:hypothetical protein